MSIHIAILMMVKNEKKRLRVTLESVKDFADSLVIFDTGSTDNTIDICKEFCEKNKIPLRLKQGDFVNFETSRNVSLDFADSFPDIDFILLMDTNDELKGGKELREFAEKFKRHDSSGFLICQEWWSGVIDKYYNIRFVKANQEWRYKGSVHEYIESRIEKNRKQQVVKLPDNISLYQDRTQDDDKSGKRFKRDKELLLIDYIKNPKETRTIFYLAQTCSCLGEKEDAYYYYKYRSMLDGFLEEKYYSYYKCGELSSGLKHDWYDTMAWYMKAYESIARAEPLLKIGEYYISKKNWKLAYTFINLTCNLDFPHDCILFVDRLSYDYKRWHLMGIVGYYAGYFEDGKNGVLKAIENGKKNNLNVDIDNNNLKFYENIESQKNIKEENDNYVKNLTLDKINEIEKNIKREMIINKINEQKKLRNKK